jgi:hypothetical protein
MHPGERRGEPRGAHTPGRTAWLADHPGAKNTARVKHVIDWIVQSFDARKYPWFGDEFVHPRDLQNASKDAGPPVNLFAGFKKVSRPELIRFPIVQTEVPDDRQRV